jgi:tetratricopeptide (TPR) repeat protein
MDTNFLLNKAIKLHLKSKIDQAEIIYKKIIKFDQNHTIALNNLATVFNLKNNYTKALSYLDKALIIKPDFVDALNNKAVSLRGLNDLHDALIYCEKALKINPNFVDALNNKANCLKSMNLLDEAILFYEKTLKLEPNNIEAIYNKSICLYLQKRFKESSSGYMRAIKLKPDFIEAYYNLALLQMLEGNYNEGLKNYEWRKKFDKAKKYPKFDDNIEWLGDKNLKNKTIYISKEQGLGDYIQYCRYLLLLKNLGAKIILDTPKVLRSMINTMEIDYKHMDDLKKLEFDYHCSIVSLPLAFNTGLHTIPAQNPYLFTPKNNIDFWAKKLNKRNKLRIGLNWTGNSSYIDDENRSTTLKELKPLLDLPFEFHSLEINYTQDDEELLSKTTNLECHKKDILGFDNTAGLIENMDLIITTDTSISHLCGALGKPVWILLSFIPDYRWLLNSEDTPWYPTAKLYRQSQKKNWQGLIFNVIKDLKIFNSKFQ